MIDEKSSNDFGEQRVVIPGITADARSLGVCRTHLYRVLTGKRKSASLTIRYSELQKNKKARKANV